MLTLGSCPAAYLSCQVDADNLGTLQFPWNASHDVNGVSSTNTTSNHAQSTSVWCMGVRANHETTGEGVVFEDDLVDDT